MKLKQLIFPVITLISVCIIIFVYFMIFSTKKLDSDSIETEKKLITAQLGEMANVLVTITEDNAFWEQAFENIELTYNPVWVEDNYIETVTTIKSINFSFILNSNQKLMFEYSDFDNIDVKDLLTPPILSHLSAMTVKDNITPVNKSIFTIIDNKLILISTSLIQHSNEQDATEFEPVQRAGLSFARVISNEALQQLSELINIKEITVTKTRPENDAYIHLNTLISSKNQFEIIVSEDYFIVWQPNLPSDILYDQALIPLVIASLVILSIFIIFYKIVENIVATNNSANEAKSNFLANMSHEIRTPLNAIMGFTQLVQTEVFGKVEGEKNKEYLELVMKSSGHLLSLINDILDLTKIEESRYQPFFEKVSLDDIVLDCINNVQASYQKKDLSLNVDLFQVSIFSDARMLKQVMLNLLTNAIKFTKINGTISVKVYENKIDGADDVIIQVIDTGIGMTEKDIEIATQKFGQVQSDYSRDHEGTGLGLPICFEMVKLLKGDIFISSAIGEGTTVSISLKKIQEPPLKSLT